MADIIDLSAHRAARAGPRFGVHAPARAWTASEEAALAMPIGAHVMVRRGGVIVRGRVETTACIHGCGRIGIRVGEGRSTGALASFDALEVEPDLAAVLHDGGAA